MQWVAHLLLLLAPRTLHQQRVGSGMLIQQLSVDESKRHTTRTHAPRAVASEIAALPSTCNIGWLRVSAKPLKQALATWASKWVYLFTKYLQDKVRLLAAGPGGLWCGVHQHTGREQPCHSGGRGEG